MSDMKIVALISARMFLIWSVSVASFVFIFLVINVPFFISQLSLVIDLLYGERSLTSSAPAVAKLVFCLTALPLLYLAFGHKFGLSSALNYFAKNHLEFMGKFIFAMCSMAYPVQVERRKIEYSITEDVILKGVKDYPWLFRMCLKLYVRRSGIVDRFESIRLEVNSRVEKGECLDLAFLQVFLQMAIKDKFKPSFVAPVLLILFNIGLFFV